MFRFRTVLSRCAYWLNPPQTALASSQHKAQKILNSASLNHCSDDSPLNASNAISHCVHHASGRAVSVSSSQKAGPFSSIQRMGNVLADQSYPLVSMHLTDGVIHDSPLPKHRMSSRAAPPSGISLRHRVDIAPKVNPWLSVKHPNPVASPRWIKLFGQARRYFSCLR